MDSYAEQLVEKKNTTQDQTMKLTILIGSVLIAILIIIVTFSFLVFFSFLIGGGIVYLGYTLCLNYEIEYEYIVTNGELDIDKIKAKTKRSRMITVKASSFESFGQVKDAKETEADVTTILVVDEENDENYYADFKSETYGNVRLVFCPNKKILDSLKPYVRLIKKQ